MNYCHRNNGTSGGGRHFQHLLWTLALVLSFLVLTCAFTCPSKQPLSVVKTDIHRLSPKISSTLNVKQDQNNERDKVEVGSKEYLEGFISSPIQDGSVSERGTGLEQALKLGGSVAAGLAILFLGFMASNGLL